MAAKKSETGKQTGGKIYKKTPVKKAPSKKGAKESAKREKKESAIKAPAGLLGQILPFVVLVVGICLCVCLLLTDAGVVGNFIRNTLFGLFAGAAYTLPLYLLLAAVLWRADKENGVLPWKIVCYSVTFLLTTMLMHFLAHGAPTFSVKTHYTDGLAHIGGGVVGGVLGELMMRAFRTEVSLILLFALLFLFILLMFGITPRGLWILLAYKIKMYREKVELSRKASFEAAEAAKERAKAKSAFVYPENEQQKLVPIPDTPVKGRRNKPLDMDLDTDDDDEEPATVVAPAESSAPAGAADGTVDEKIFDEVMRRTQERLALSGTADEVQTAEEDDLPWDETLTPERTSADIMDGDSLNRMEEEELDLSAIFTEPSGEDLFSRFEKNNDRDAGDGAADMDIELSVERKTLTEIRTPAEQPAALSAETPETEPEYRFPPIHLLTEDANVKDENVAEELRENAARLVETLKNFNVRTKIVDVCRGPTITRYELAPEPGTKVRSIANLVDDIALNLATSGVRFEPSIPGKSAVGIEVPNKNAMTVHLRTLLENPRFGSSKSRLTAALGQDVAGADVFLDVAKMPHLLIAGATGQGKSVCINSLIVSLLYKAKPDELKFIMVDPKKVELNIYNGIPHLYMPVISDPKKAAGALSWAVSEMERRYSLIEEVGVRDLKSYNEITKDDPQYEFLPQFVIIIDELADLMMVAKNDVESPICRIAQKARAAGMHLIIGTQRPSVDVITGLIKANFPSRISFRVSQLVDSRTIIDRAGAESLVGRGDMLYSPVGSHEPMRVQGAFVSDAEVESVVEFIKLNNGGAEYNSTAIAEVERNAASIGTGKKDSVGGDEEDGGLDDDPMLRPAIELAVESGKISTSLIQRRLSLGYGRAAKLIDRMEQLGYVSAPEGQKPRDVLISKEQFMEMVLRDTDS